MVREAKKRVNEEWTLSIAENFKENKKKIWKGVNEARKEENMRLASVRNSMDEELSWENDIEVRWIKYFVQLLNGDEISEVGVRRVRIGGIKSIYKDGKVGDNGYSTKFHTYVEYPEQPFNYGNTSIFQHF